MSRNSKILDRPTPAEEARRWWRGLTKKEKRHFITLVNRAFKRGDVDRQQAHFHVTAGETNNMPFVA